MSAAGSDQQQREAAEILAARRGAAQPFDGFDDAHRPTGEADAYAIQNLVTDELGRRGRGRHAGWKIGCTTAVMQEYLGIPSPCAGHMLADHLWQTGVELAARDYCRIGMECELAVQLSADLPAAGRPYDIDDVAGAVGAAMASIEVVDDRYVDYRALDVFTLVADDFFHDGCVVGLPNVDLDPRDLKRLGGRLLIDGSEIGSGTGADILGDPLAALAWLANGPASGAHGLHAGQIVTLGSLVKTYWPDAEQTVEIEIEDLGALKIQVV